MAAAMARTLLVVRHGHAVAASGRDRDRPLSEPGRAAVREVARLFARHALLPAQLHASPYVRARETAEILAAARSPQALVRLTPHLEPESDPALAIEELDASGAGPWVCVSHMPMVGRLVEMLVKDVADPMFAPGSAALLALPAGLSSRGTLRWIAAPHELASLLGRELCP